MKTRNLLAPILLLALCGVASQCLAVAVLKPISRDKAKELGISVTVGKSANDDARVQIDFKRTGRLKGFQWADLELTRGSKRLLAAALLPRESKPDSVHLEFYMDPAALPETNVVIFDYSVPDNEPGFVLQMKDFLPKSVRR